LEFLQAQAIEH